MNEKLLHMTQKAFDMGDNEIITLKAKLKRKNMQIKKLKEKINELYDTPINAHGETLRLKIVLIKENEK